MKMSFNMPQGNNCGLENRRHVMMIGAGEHNNIKQIKKHIPSTRTIGKYINKTTLIDLLFCCAPLMIFLLVIFFLKANPFRWVPLWNDAAGWFIQINAAVKYGAPLGFTGYNETHAAIGTFGPWGAFIVCAMSLFGKVFGWHYYSPLFMNVAYWMLANFIFLLFAKPKRLTVAKLTVLNFILFLSIQYMFTGMSECTRFSMAIVLAGMFCFLLKDENKNSKWYVIVLGCVAPILLFFFINSYILFSFLLPVYGYVLFKYLNPRRCRSLLFVSLCALLPVLFFLVCFFIQAKTTAPYTTSTVRTYLNQPNIGAFLKVLKNTVAANLRNADITFIFKNSKAANGCISSYLLFYYLLVIAAAIQLVVAVKVNKKPHPLNVLIVYALSTFVVAFLALYSTQLSWTYIRGLNVALVFSLYLVCMLDWPKLQPVLFGLMFVQLLPFLSIIRDDMAIRYSPRNIYGGGYELLEKYSTVFSSKLVPSKTEDPWDNTVACYGRSYNIGCAFPAGLSWNYIMDGHAVSKPKYIVTDSQRNWTFNGYWKTYSDDLIFIFEKIKGEAK